MDARILGLGPSSRGVLLGSAADSWAAVNADYVWYDGYWGPTVGFYGASTTALVIPAMAITVENGVAASFITT
jgi:hypothetical protein